MRPIQIIDPQDFTNLLVRKKNGTTYMQLQEALKGRKNPEWCLVVEMCQGKHDKFYEVGEDANGYYIRYGRNGTNGKRMEHPSFYSIMAKLEEKRSKGYLEVTKLNFGKECLLTAYQRSQARSEMTFENLTELRQAGTDVPVNLRGINAMLAMVKAVRYIAEEGRYKGVNEIGEVVITIPDHITAHEDFKSITGRTLPSIARPGRA